LVHDVKYLKIASQGHQIHVSHVMTPPEDVTSFEVSAIYVHQEALWPLGTIRWQSSTLRQDRYVIDGTG
jgi:hypothetical protein